MSKKVVNKYEEHNLRIKNEVSRILKDKNHLKENLKSLLDSDSAELFEDLLDTDPSLANERINDNFNLLHEALLNESFDIIYYLVNHHPDLIAESSNNGRSSFLISLMSKEKELINFIEPRIDLSNEINNIVNSEQIDNKNELLEFFIDYCGEEKFTMLVYSLLTEYGKDNAKELVSRYKGDLKGLLDDLNHICSLEFAKQVVVFEDEDFGQVTMMMYDGSSNAEKEGVEALIGSLMIDFLDSIDVYPIIFAE